MKNAATPAAASNVPEELSTLREYWIWFLAMGAAMVVFGAAAISRACIGEVTVAVTWVFGFLLLAGGIAEIVHSFLAGRWSGTLIHLLIGVLYCLVGFMIIEQPKESAIQLTLIIAVFLMVGGVFRIVFALSERFAGWPWVLLNGGVTFLLGLLIYKQWPDSGLWVIGLFVGIEMIFNGVAWVMLALGVKKAAAA